MALGSPSVYQLNRTIVRFSGVLYDVGYLAAYLELTEGVWVTLKPFC